MGVLDDYAAQKKKAYSAGAAGTTKTSAPVPNALTSNVAPQTWHPPMAPAPSAPLPGFPAPAPKPNSYSQYVNAPSGKQSYTGGGVTASATGTYGGTPITGAVGGAGSAAPQFDPNTWDPNTDEQYQLEAGGVNHDTDSLLAQLAAQRNNYDIDFKGALRNLGWAGPSQDAGLDDILSQGHWNEDDLLGAYGQSMNNQENDFAGRGMMNSSFYDRAHSDLGTSFANQRSSMVQSRGNQLADIERQRADAEAQRAQALAQAKQAAAARAAALYSLGG